ANNNLAMIRLEPVRDLLSDPLSQSDHLCCFLVRYHADPLIPTDISLFPKSVELSDERRVRSYGQGEALNDPVMMSVSRSTVPASRQCRRCRLESSVIGNIKFPFGAKPLCPAISQVSIRYGQ